MTSNAETEPLLNSVNSDMSTEYSAIHELPPRRRQINITRGGIVPGVIILILVLLERIGYYSLTGNLYLFLHQRQFYWKYYNAVSALLIFTGTSYLSCLFGGWIADAWLGRFKTIGFAFVVFTGAYWFMPFMSNFCPQNTFMNMTTNYSDNSEVPLFKEHCSAGLMSVLIVAAIGTGTAKANITAFGAEQVQYSGPDGLRVYLNWLYWCVNIGALIAILGITYLQQNDMEGGYTIPASLLGAATLIFWLTFPFYINHSPSGSSISRTFQVVKEAWKLNCQENSNTATVNRPLWLDFAKVRYGGKFHESVVEDVKSLSTILKVFVVLVPYWMVYFQMQSTFLAQGLQMRLNPSSTNATDSTENNTFEIPAAWLMLFNVIFLIIFIPLMNHVIYPFLNKRGIEISMLTRMAIGMISAFISMTIAGLLELCRLTFIAKHKIVTQIIDKTTFDAADLSILWQIPQYSLIGISEVFTSVSGMEFACSQAPSTMQGAVMGLYYFFTGVGSLLGVAVLKIYEGLNNEVNIRHGSDINQANLYCYFFLLAFLQLLGLLVFCCMIKNLKIRKPFSMGTISSVLGTSRARSQ